MPERKSCYLIVAIALSIHICFLISLGSGFMDRLFFDTSTYPRGADFIGVHQSGTKAVFGDSIYDGLGNRYLPAVIYLLVVPLNLLGAGAAYWFWVTVLEALVVLNIALSYRLANSIDDFFFSSAMWLSFSPLYIDLFMGQFSFLMASVVFLTSYGFLRRREVLFSISWIVSVLLKVITILFIPFFLKIGRKRLVTLCVFILLATTVPYFAFFRDDIAWYAINFSPEAGLYPGSLGLQSLLAVTATTIPLISSKLAITAQIYGHQVDINFLFLFVSLAFVVVALRGSVRSNERLFLENTSLWILIYFLIYGKVWEHHYNFLLPVLVLLYLFKTVNRKLVVICYLLLAVPTPFFLVRYWDIYPIRVLYHSFKVVPVLMLFFPLLRRVSLGEVR